MDALLVSPPLLLTQHILLYLAGGGLWQGTEIDGHRTLEMGEALPAEGDDLLLGCRLLWFEGHKGLGTLTPFLVGDGDDGALHDSRVLRHGLLHLDGRDVLTARDDHILRTVARSEEHTSELQSRGHLVCR